MPYPQGTKIPDFSKFSGKGGKTTDEHISQFLAHLKDLADREAYYVCLFSLYLTSTAFMWYTSLPANSINSWEELEHKFHEHFFLGEHELELADLASVL
jgi:inosine/xanthosine triphosphate pyrophosphatase family protein